MDLGIIIEVSPSEDHHIDWHYIQLIFDTENEALLEPNG